MNENPFYIVGFMGTGKSTLFSFLKEYGEVIDLDLVIESMTGMEIATYFDRYGESAFRDVESKVLQQVTADYILTGGGVVERSENICWMRERGTMIHLNLPFDMCWERIKDSARPLVKRGREDVHALFQRRDQLYRKASVSIDASQSPEDIAKQIIRIKGEKE
ncbi:MAG: shikimate kinase [Exiguobacterium sp.]|uniref:Shikimate kinase n=1 Tax=Exiguobacterium profundum TaxID=307643 RepID=A0ABY8B2T4_9BACL|nr:MULTISPECIES: shikimate kinase [Exiguobacterium]MBQ6458618.1 shikimate kinase [Exiguobacterium sp.]WED56441.1 shikimate kinase [Exiguobacterium profundum]